MYSKQSDCEFTFGCTGRGLCLPLYLVLGTASLLLFLEMAAVVEAMPVRAVGTAEGAGALAGVPRSE